ncbi:hypothetical protein LEMLEM_LOCUS21607, partial [Lemmus lemmus]
VVSQSLRPSPPLPHSCSPCLLTSSFSLFQLPDSAAVESYSLLPCCFLLMRLDLNADWQM